MVLASAGDATSRSAGERDVFSTTGAYSVNRLDRWPGRVGLEALSISRLGSLTGGSTSNTGGRWTPTRRRCGTRGDQAARSAVAKISVMRGVTGRRRRCGGDPRERIADRSSLPLDIGAKPRRTAGLSPSAARGRSREAALTGPTPAPPSFVSRGRASEIRRHAGPRSIFASARSPKRSRDTGHPYNESDPGVESWVPAWATVRVA